MIYWSCFTHISLMFYDNRIFGILKFTCFQSQYNQILKFLHAFFILYTAKNNFSVTSFLHIRLVFVYLPQAYSYIYFFHILFLCFFLLLKTSVTTLCLFSNSFLVIFVFLLWFLLTLLYHSLIITISLHSEKTYFEKHVIIKPTGT